MLARVARCESDFEMALWTAGRSLVVPSSMAQKPLFESAASASVVRGWPVVLRPSGGGVVPQGPGILNLAVVSVADGKKCQDPVAFFQVLTDLIASTVTRVGAVSIGPVNGSFCDGKFNVAVDGRKLAGTAQRWTIRNARSHEYAVLAHATILCAADIPASCAAVEYFCGELGEPISLDPDAHINLQEVLSKDSDAFAHSAGIFRDHLLGSEFANLPVA